MVELLKTYLEFLWPPYLIAFPAQAKSLRSGTGLGPGLWALFEPILWIIWGFALLTDIAIVGSVVYFIIHHISLH